jgi:hypothetical protein
MELCAIACEGKERMWEEGLVIVLVSVLVSVNACMGSIMESLRR